MFRKFSAHARKQVVADYLGGMSAKDVGAKHGIHLQTVLNLVRRAGAEVRPPYYSIGYGITILLPDNHCGWC